MMHNIAFKANWNRIQDLIDNFSCKENKSCIPHKYQYKVGDKVLLETHGILRKLSSSCTGTYPVTKVYKNGTIQIQKGIISERVNIRRICPFPATPG
jgi:phage-related protein